MAPFMTGSRHPVSGQALSVFQTLLLSLGTCAVLVSGQAFSFCNPLEAKCPPAPGFTSGQPYTTDFRTGSDDRIWSSVGWSSLPITYPPGVGAKFSINRQGDSPVLETDQYIFFGSVEVHLRSAPGQGIVSCVVLLSDTLDEIDFEMLGGEPHRGLVQTNYFGKGVTGNYENGAGHWLPSSGYGYGASTTATVHNYTIDWDMEKIVWYIDGVQVRRLDKSAARPVSTVPGRDNFPQTPARVRIGIWAGGDPGNDPGTVDWAGGETNFGGGPYEAVVEYVRIVNKYPAVAYWMRDCNGQWDGVELLDRYFERGDRGAYVSGYGERIEGGYRGNFAGRSVAGAFTETAVEEETDGSDDEDSDDDGRAYGHHQQRGTSTGIIVVEESHGHGEDHAQTDARAGAEAGSDTSGETSNEDSRGQDSDGGQKDDGVNATEHPGQGHGHDEPEPKLEPENEPGSVGTGGTREGGVPGAPDRPNGTPVAHLDHVESLSVVKAELDRQWQLAGAVVAVVLCLF